MIFVTVGTTLCFDELIEAVDAFVRDGRIKGPVLCQIGNGAYQPGHCEHFRFRPTIEDLMLKASVVICHGGTGTVLNLLAMGKPFIAVANRSGADNHQAQFLARLEKEIPILWTADVRELPELVMKAGTVKAGAVKDGRLSDDIKRYIEGL
jgi:UDP-N-acetylglucosamine transferase subunit ALG13